MMMHCEGAFLERKDFSGISEKTVFDDHGNVTKNVLIINLKGVETKMLLTFKELRMTPGTGGEVQNV